MTWPTLSELRAAAIRPPTPHQEEQYLAASAGKVSLLRGGPGTGKSFLTAAIIRALTARDDVSAEDIAISAPTGKAAQRIGELLSEYNISGVRPQTIHSILGPQRNGHDGEGWGFFYNRANRLPAKYLIVDESSMLDIVLHSQLLAACPDDIHVLFVGDPFQLPPVGNGRPFADMLRAGVPAGNLQEVHRFSGRVAAICKAIRERQPWQPSPQLDLEAEFPENFKHIEYPQPARQVAACQAVIDRMIERGRDPMRDLQVICPTNEKSPLSRSVLNTALQHKLNAGGAVIEGGKLRVGDKVVNRKNTWFQLAMLRGQSWIANGESGVVLEATKTGAITVDFSTGVEPDPQSKSVVVNKGQWKQIELAYATTGHSSQGSQWPVVIAMIDEYQPARLLCNRSWWYTVLSRSSELMVTIGKLGLLKQDCRQAGVEMRKTYLAERIKGGQGWQDQQLSPASS